MRTKLQTYFLKPKTPKHKLYEALRAYAIEGSNAKEIGERFGLSENTIFTLAHQLKTGNLTFFQEVKKGPKERRVNPSVRKIICDLRKQNFSTADIVESLKKDNITLSESTVERVLKDEGFGKLMRRTGFQRGMTKNNTLLSMNSQNLNFSELKPFNEQCQIAGLFVFLPYLIESGLIDIFKKLPLPESQQVGKVQAGLSFLLLKLIGGRRLSHIGQYDRDIGFGIFAGLNVLPKPTYMGTYSCRMSAEMCQLFQKEMIGSFIIKNPDFFNGKTINLDFHSIPHFGEKSEMEKVWCGTRNKAMKGANTFFAQDAETKTILYTNADILRKNECSEILKFVDYFKDIKGIIKETLVFDSRLTSYKALDELNSNGIKFITLRRRSDSLIKRTIGIAECKWNRVEITIPKRKYRNVSVYESIIRLKGCKSEFRQIAIKDNGRQDPTFVITNNTEMDTVELLTVYARRWRIENKLSELVDFFNINAVSSPLMVRIHFDLLMTVAASFLYQRLAEDLPRFEKHLAPDIFRRFIDFPGSIRFDGNHFEIHIRKRAHTPILLGIKKLNQPITVPWLDNKVIKIVWRA